jgi:hypothetical protein
VRQWATYRNAKYSLSLSYPANDWSLYEGYDGSWAELTPRDKSRFGQAPKIAVAAAPGEPSDGRGRPRTLQEQFEAILKAIREYGRAQDISVLSKGRVTLLGLPAIVGSIQYRSPSGERWFEKSVLIHTVDDRLTYQLELQCSPGDLPVLMPIFDGVVSTLQIAQPPPATCQPLRQGGERWTTYRNANYSFSLSYPARGWRLYEGEDGNGMNLTPLEKSRFRLTPEMGAGGAVGQPSDADEHRCRTLEEDFEFGLDAIRHYDRAQNLILLSKKRARVQGLPAIVRSIRYEDALGEVWFDKDVLIHTRNDWVTYHLGLRCSPADLPALMPIFNKLVRTFRILGPRR